MTKSKKKIIFLTTSFILTICLMGFMGVYALTILKNSQINVGISYQPEYLVKVEMGIDGANGETFNQKIEESEYVEIYNSLNPVSNGMYIQSMSSDTIHINSQTLTPIGVKGDVYFKITSLENATSGNKDLRCVIDCGSSKADSGKIASDETKTLTIETKLDATAGQITESVLGFIKISLNFQEYQPMLTVFNFEVSLLNVIQGSSYEDVINQINDLTVIGKFEDESEKNLILNTDYILELNRTDGGGTNNFNDVGIAGTITAIAISNNDIQATINLNVQLLYNIYKYVEGTGPVYDNNNTSNRYVHYVEMGEYPQTYYGTALPKAESEYEITADYYYNMKGERNEQQSIIKSALYKDKTTGQKFAKQGTNFYNVEPVRWIVIGVTDGVYSGGQHVLFTTGNQAENEDSTSGLWFYNEVTKAFEYRTTIGGEWQTASEVLVLSEYGLLRSTYKNTGYDKSPYNHFSVSDINEVLNTNANSLYNTMFTDNQREKIIPKTMPITSYYKKLNSTDYNDVEYNLFLLGSNKNWESDDTKLVNEIDSYNLGTYFKPLNEKSGQTNLIVYETAYSSNSNQDDTNNFTVYRSWLRSGRYSINWTSALLTIDGLVGNSYLYYSYALRPAFVLNLA